MAHRNELSGESSEITSKLPTKVRLVIATKSSLLLNTKQPIKVAIKLSQIVCPIFFVLAGAYFSYLTIETSPDHFVFSFPSLRYLYIS